MQNKLFYPADILLPKSDFTEWSVIACDQYTSEPRYWEDVKETVGDKPSALNIILPEAYLQGDNSKAIEKINSTMKKYIDSDVFNCYENAMIYTRRTLKDGKVRNGIVGLIDLEDYSYLKGSDCLIRATEQTVIERIPPRVNIRRDAPLEIPHVMLLINDSDNTVIEPVAENSDKLERIYSFPLMKNSGSIDGFLLRSTDIENVEAALKNLKAESEDGLLFAVGDGNHSLASAKECYNQGYCSRYAMVEIVNIHDSSLEFEPIYRIVYGEEPQKLIDAFTEWCGGEYVENDSQKFECYFGNSVKTVNVKAKGTLCVATLQAFLDEYIENNPTVKIDYIHGTDSLKALAQKENSTGFIFDGMSKSDLFNAVSRDGSLPRKTFSMGCADDKRFYLEARIIK